MDGIMKKQFSRISLTFLVCIPLLMMLVNSAEAQTPTAIPTSLPTSTLPPTPTLSPTLVSPLPTDVVQLANPDVVTFSQLGKSEIQLNGPSDRTAVYFSIPADWTLKEGIQLDLLVGVSYNTGLQDQSGVIVVSGGTLKVLLNGTVLLTTPLNDVGETEIKINIPVSTALGDDGDMSLEFVLDSGTSCRIIGSQTTVYIHPTSYFYFPHNLTQPPTSLIDFPRPIFQNTFFPNSALLVIPDQPTAAELQAALTVAAGLGNLSYGQLVLDMVTLGKLKEDLTKQHLIFVGKAGSLPLLGSLNLPMSIVNGQFSDGGVDDGLIGMVNSPWSSSHVVLVVSANTDAGIVKAAQAVSSGVIRPNRFENLAVIERVNTLPVSGLQVIDQTLSDLGYEFRSFQSKGQAGQEYLFNVPAGMTVSTEAYFDMVYGHSSLIDYGASEIIILLNDQPIGSVRMSDTTATVPTNHAKIMVPPLAVLPGDNRLRVRVVLEPIADCTSPNSLGLWVNVWPQSLIHLPLMATSLDPLISRDLAAYPTPFIYHSTLGSTAFVLERNDPESWRDAMQIAFFLGDHANGPLIQLSAFYGDAMPVTERSKYHLLVVGRPSQMPIVAEMNNDLPAPFISGGDIVSDTGNFQVTYRIPPNSPMGYIETMLSPWNSENVVLAVLGNTAQGVNWAATALVDSTLRGQLGGNFAVVNNKQIISSSTRYVEISSGEVPAAEIPSIITTPPSETATDFPKTRPGWILPVLVVSIGLIVFFTVWRFRISHVKNKIK
jgi:cellulose synthase operon protein B